jgi:poly-gamma-glutamate capsule biosynthesis protein CapA/YwtB (metallophosphatase superfamily)
VVSDLNVGARPALSPPGPKRFRALGWPRINAARQGREYGDDGAHELRGDMAGAAITVFACGDVMTGRGIDQILPHPGDPELREVSVTDARDYVGLAERASGPIPRPVSFSWPWGDAVAIIEEAAPDARIINLETSITRSGDFAPGKEVTYRMSPDNIACVSAVRPHVCALANNHVLDFGRAGLAETLACLAGAGLTVAGAGGDADAAAAPAAVEVPGRGRVLVYSCAHASSGVPPGWAAEPGRSGVNLLPGLSGDDADRVIGQIGRHRREGDLAVVSIHWGSNWGYDVNGAQVLFAHRLIDGGVDLIHGHSSHHPRPVEVYRGRGILYGCGDCIDDYEGIAGYEEFRDDLRLLFFASLTPGTGELEDLRMVPVRARKMRLQPAGEEDSQWLTTTLSRIGRRFGSRFACLPDGVIVLRDHRE